VSTLWAEERLCYPLHAVPYTPVRHFARGRNDSAFRTKLRLAAALARNARAAGWPFVRWRPTAPTATTMPSGPSCAPRECRS
jgi:uncharacterized protein (DUF58 family)